MRLGACATLIASVLCLLVGSACAQTSQSSSAKKDFVLHCADCHGVDGKGNGPLAIKLKTKPTDLTRLAKRNDGVFSPEVVYKMMRASRR